jgi:hypothetical protein
VEPDVQRQELIHRHLIGVHLSQQPGSTGQLRRIRLGVGHRPRLQQHAGFHDVRHRKVLRGHVQPQG